MKIRSLQLNPIVGDMQKNAEILLAQCHIAVADGIDLVITPECYLCGYPPEDLIFRPAFAAQIEQSILWLADKLSDLNIGVILGTPRFDNGNIFNSAMWLLNGNIIPFCDKQYLPDYGVFDDARLFSKGDFTQIITYKNTKIGAMICEDMWYDCTAKNLKNLGAELLICLNASPFEINKHSKRLAVAKARCQDTNLALVTSFMVGGQDEIIFDGFSFALNATGELIAECQGFVTDFYDVSFINNQLVGQQITDVNNSADMSIQALIYQAITLGLRDYVLKNNFKGIVLGLSGGVDSVISVAIAIDAIGVDKVHCLLLPSQFTSQESFDDAYALIDAVGMSYDIVAIQESVSSVESAMSDIFSGLCHDLTEENIQSRMRGLMLMAYSNKMGHMVLTTGNKSEMAVGYATLYGDMCGGYNALKDVYKTTIYDLCQYRNHYKPHWLLGKTGTIIPQNVITKAPTAELRDNQKDSDSLPDYPVLDAILYRMIEQDMAIDAIIAQGFERDIVIKIRQLVDRSEYKRRQSAPGAKISPKNFGRDRRYPITHKFFV